MQVGADPPETGVVTALKVNSATKLEGQGSGLCHLPLSLGFQVLVSFE